MNIEHQVTLNSIINSICLIVVAVFTILAFTWSIPKREEQNGYDTALEYIRSHYTIDELQSRLNYYKIRLN